MELDRRSGRKQLKEQWKALRYGWYVGDDRFRDEMLKKLVHVLEGRERASYHGEAIRHHDEQEAERLVRQGMKVLRMTEKQLADLSKGDDKKCVLAWLAHTRTMAGHKWIGERLRMGGPAHISVHVARVKNAQQGDVATLRRRVSGGKQ